MYDKSKKKQLTKYYHGWSINSKNVHVLYGGENSSENERSEKNKEKESSSDPDRIENKRISHAHRFDIE